MNDTAPVTVYWRPGCGFCHVLRRELDRAGVGRTEINIWEDPAAAAVVRSHAWGNETVPTVLVGDLALVNPTAKEVIAARERTAGTGTPTPQLEAISSETSSGSAWPGITGTVAACAVWSGLALANPTTTYHLAPAVALLAWPVITRSQSPAASWRPGLLAAAGAALSVATTALLLARRDALAGPALIGTNATAETIMLAAAALGAALALARPRRGSLAAHSGNPAPGDRPGAVTVVGSGGGCTSATGDSQDEQCNWTPERLEG